MGQRIAGTGQGLPAPQYLYPSELNPTNTPLDMGNNYLTLAPGNSIAIPAGSWYVAPGPYCIMQYLDPVTGIWRQMSSARIKTHYIVSDGFNYRVSNLTGCAVAAVVTAGGSGYAAATTTVSSSSGGSTWQAVVGGMVSLSTINNAGSGYGIPPMLFIGAPPVGGVQATGHCTLQSGTVAAVTLDNVGGGYVTAPSAVIVTSPYDPNINATIVPATVTLVLVGSGSIAAVLCTNPGNSISAAPTLTVSSTGAGTGASVTALRLQTFVSATVASAGTWTGGAYLTSVGGSAGATSQWTNPEISQTNFIPRPMEVLLSGATSLSSVSAIYDGGLFLSAPTLSVAPVGGAIAPASTATVTAVYGGVADTVLIQPAP